MMVSTVMGAAMMGAAEMFAAGMGADTSCTYAHCTAIASHSDRVQGKHVIVGYYLETDTQY